MYIMLPYSTSKPAPNHGNKRFLRSPFHRPPAQSRSFGSCRGPLRAFARLLLRRRLVESRAIGKFEGPGLGVETVPSGLGGKTGSSGPGGETGPSGPEGKVGLRRPEDDGESF